MMEQPRKEQMSGVTRGQSGAPEERSPRANEQASEANPLSEAIIEGINYALIVIDGAFRVVRHNQRFVDIFQIALNDETSFSLAEALPDNRLESIIRQSVEAGESIQEAEFSCQIGDHERHFLLSISSINLPSSEKGTLITFDEVTEWKRHQSQVMEASRLVSIGEMAAGIAHEVNNPLAAVMGFTQLAMRRNEDSSIKRDLEKILSESKRASKIISNLQSFARRYKPNRAEVDIVSVLQKVLEFRGYELEVGNIEVKTTLEPGLPYVSGDEHQLEQVILNFVINAEHFMFAAHGGGTLTIDVAREGDKIRISFADDGPGINTEHLTKIFDPFFTTKEVGQGTGLGLSICYGIVHEHGGTIVVNSAEGQGATFTIELPVAPQSESSSHRHSSEGEVSQNRDNLNVLIVDDEASVAEFVSRALTEYGHTVEVSGSGSDVIQKGGLDKYDVFILDVKMPGIGGAALYEHIDGVSKELSSRVLFITGDTTNPGIKEFIDQTSSPLLTKPFTIENLLSMVNRFTSKRNPAYLEGSK